MVSLFLYAIFLLIQTMRHRGYFMESERAVVAADPVDHSLRVQSTAFHAPMLVLYLIVVILLAEKFAIPLDNSIEQFGMPQEFGGAMIAALVLTPEGIGAIRATLRNQLQRSINILLGSVLATIGLTIPAVSDHQLGHETTGDARGARRQPSAAAVNAGSERGYVHQQKDKYLTGLRSFVPLRSVSTADILPVRFVQRVQLRLGAQVCRPVFRAQC